MSTKQINWLMFYSLVFMWGTSFLVTSVAVDQFTPIQISSMRITLGAIILLVAARIRGRQLPRDLRSWSYLALFGIMGNALPFFLISWGQQSVSSGTTGVLMAFMPLITMILAHYFIANETLNRYKIMGCCLSFCGVALLLGPQIEGSHSMIAQLAIFCAAASYAANTILIRKLPKFDPLVGGAGMLLVASALSVPIALYQGFDNLTAPSSGAIYAIIWLGVVPTGIASILYFSLVERAGPSFISNVNYLIPVLAFFSGIVLLDEDVTWLSLLSVAVILSGIALTRKPVRAKVSL
ncbi:MAG: DMT family transporter [Oceanospirillaceae bacterium]|nr:DMT family transporter [Oceanospirillaceae bacterium]